MLFLCRWRKYNSLGFGEVIKKKFQKLLALLEKEKGFTGKKKFQADVEYWDWRFRFSQPWWWTPSISIKKI